MKPYRATRCRACDHAFVSEDSPVRRACNIRTRGECGTRRGESKKLMEPMYQYPHRTGLLPVNSLPCPACSVPSIFVWCVRKCLRHRHAVNGARKPGDCSSSGIPAVRENGSVDVRARALPVFRSPRPVFTILNIPLPSDDDAAIARRRLFQDGASTARCVDRSIAVGRRTRLRACVYATHQELIGGHGKTLGGGMAHRPGFGTRVTEDSHGPVPACMRRKGRNFKSSHPVKTDRSAFQPTCLVSLGKCELRRGYFAAGGSRNSRLRIFPTFVFGNSVRNSTNLGCL